MRALKFLDEGGVGRFSAFRWPQPSAAGPGDWVEAGGEAHACVRGVHACTKETLPYWLGPELYVIELEGAITRAESKVVAERGRLVRRVEAWDRDKQRAFAAAATLHARHATAAILRAEGEIALADRVGACADLPALAAVARDAKSESERGRLSLQYLSDAVVYGAASPPGGAYCAAHAGLDTASYLAERAFQARWLVEDLALDAALGA
jgi:hypothetical protein